MKNTEKRDFKIINIKSVSCGVISAKCRCSWSHQEGKGTKPKNKFEQIMTKNFKIYKIRHKQLSNPKHEENYFKTHHNQTV